MVIPGSRVVNTVARVPAGGATEIPRLAATLRTSARDAIVCSLGIAVARSETAWNCTNAATGRGGGILRFSTTAEPEAAKGGAAGGAMIGGA